MSIFPYQDGNVAVKNDSIIFSEGQTAQSVNILLQGKVDVFMSPMENCSGMGEEEILKKSYKLFRIDQNMFLGACGLFLDRQHTFTYRASEDCNIFIFCVPTSEKLSSLLDSHKDYGAYLMTSISSSINASEAALQKLNIFLRELDRTTKNLVLYFWHLKEKCNFQHAPSGSFFAEGLSRFQQAQARNLIFPSAFDASFFDQELLEDSEFGASPICSAADTEVEYYRHFVNIPMDARKSFFSQDCFITTYHCTEAAKFLTLLQGRLRETLRTLRDLFNRLYTADGECVFSEYCKAASELKLENPATYEVFKTLDYITVKINDWSQLFMKEYEYSSGIDPETLERIVDQVKVGDRITSLQETISSPGSLEVQEAQASLPEELKDSAVKIVEYSGIPKERGDLFITSLAAFRKLRDKFSLDDESGNVRKSISSAFFEIYEAVLKKVLVEKSQSKLHHMFLLFGYMDEKLLQPEHIVALYDMVDKFMPNGESSVFNMRDWLTAIYEMRRDPSMNEFSQDYFDIFREMKKRREVTDRDKTAYNSNIDARLHFEVANMFRVNHRVCYGQPGSYFPILHNDMITRDISKALVTPQRIQESLDKLLETDFSAFHREISYRNPDKGIEKELIMKAILPDFILMPTFGTRAIMWQEIAGRNRSTPARFILPILTGENLDDLIVKLVGNFRWELCRTMMGAGWNDITQKSLTSEYTDYIQFYKKNKDLSEDAREKISAQISRYRNMMREIFSADYEQWINHEAKGIIRLNKVSRSILFKYCPLPKNVREQLAKHPMFTDLETQFRNIRTKQAKDLENRYQKLFKSNAVEEDMQENLRFYKEL